MADSPQAPLHWNWSFWIAFALLALFPAVCVNSASLEMRLGWMIALSVFFMLVLVISTKTRNDPKIRLTRPYFQRRRRVIRTIVIAAPALALTLSVAATYAVPERPLLWRMTIFIAQLGSAILPIVSKFATHMDPPLAHIILYKAQSVVTLFMLAGFVVSIAVVTQILFTPKNERRAMREITERYGRRIRSPAMIWLCSPFVLIFGLGILFGWFGFSPEPKNMQGARCLATAACYVRNDILLLAGALLAACMSCIAWAGTFLMLRDAIDRDNS